MDDGSADQTAQSGWCQYPSRQFQWKYINNQGGPRHKYVALLRFAIRRGRYAWICLFFLFMGMAGYLGGSVLTRITTVPRPGAQLGGMIYVCDGLETVPYYSSGCPSERVAPNRRITFKPIGLFAPEVSATTNNNGIYSVVILPGRYRVSIGGCRRYVVQPTVAKDLDLTVVDGTNDERSMPSLYWLIDSGGNCYQDPPLGL